jgi:drug/metabolite transporter (DMT)-like permease
LLNLEGLATMVLAWLMFRENVDRRLLIGAAAILGGAVLLSWQGGVDGAAWGGFGWPEAAIVAACIAWGLDNNLTRRLSAADPAQIAMIKGLAAGAANLALAAAAGARTPAAAAIGGAALVGFFGYGVSLVLFVLALRHLGTARTGAYFSTAPFLGAALALVLFREAPTLELGAAALLMGLGVWLHLSESHEHEHAHEALDHEHRHIHDAHHQHDHGPQDPPGEPHTHAHHHAPMRHKHPHYPDLHHRHGHAAK